jgi:two-component system phosphate regulon response regulator PhoB
MKKKIILVESEPELVDIYRRIFQKTDFDVEHASKKEQMLEELRDIRTGASAKPDLVILDFVLSDGDGIEILKAMKKNVLTRDIPVFAITNYQNPDLDRKIKFLGITPEKYLIKAHYTPGELVDMVGHYFRQGDDRQMTTLS